jgi:hypothetical protein
MVVVAGHATTRIVVGVPSVATANSHEGTDLVLIVSFRIDAEPTQVLTLSLRQWLAERRIQSFDLRTKSMNEADAESQRRLLECFLPGGISIQPVVQ